MAKKHYLSALSRRRLNTLIAFMARRRSGRHFYMGHWFQHDGDHALAKPGTVLTPRHLNDCGTTACAMGWAGTIKTFQRAGLKLVAVPNGAEFMVNGRKCDGFGAATRFFRIKSDLANELFARTYTNTPRQWAEAARLEVDRYDACGWL